MRNVKIAVLLALALCAGCSFSAGISRGQTLESDLMPSVVVERDDMRRCHNSTVRIRAYSANNQLIWLGTGSVFKIENGRVHILSNNHVCLNPKGRITVEPIIDGISKGEFNARVDLCVEDNGIDVAVVSLPQGKTLEKIEFIPIRKTELEVGQEIYWVGCDRGNQQNGQIGRILDVSEQHILMSPKSIGGDSGSSVVQFDEYGNPHVVALIAWVTTLDGKQVAMAMKSSVVLDVLAGGKLPDLPSEGDVPPSSIETERLIQGLLQRLRELREDAKREREGLRDRLSQMQLDAAQEAQNTQLWRDRFKKQQDDIIEKSDGMTDKIMGQFTTLKQMVTLAKYAFYALVAALLISIFAGQGWLSRVIVTIFKLLFHGIRGAITIVLDAVAKPIKETNSPKEALDNLRSEIGDALEDDS